MRERAFIHVAGPPGSGKTTLIQSILATHRRPILVARCVRKDMLKRPHESRRPDDPELRRYLQSGAYDAAVFAFAGQELSSVHFYETDLMLNYSEAVLLEGENPAFYSDLEVFVAPAPVAGEAPYIRQQHDVAAARRTTLAAWEALLEKPDGIAMWRDQVMGTPVPELRKYPSVLEAGRSTLLAGIGAARAAPPPQPVEHWAVSESFRGIEAAGLVIVNIRVESQRPAAEQLVADVHRLRKDDAMGKDILGWHGSRLPVTAVVANVAELRDGGCRKLLLASVERCARSFEHQKRQANMTPHWLNEPGGGSVAPAWLYGGISGSADSKRWIQRPRRANGRGGVNATVGSGGVVRYRLWMTASRSSRKSGRLEFQQVSPSHQ